MNEDYCMVCKRKLERDEIALHKKLVNRGAHEFMCITCLGKHFDVLQRLREGEKMVAVVAPAILGQYTNEY